MKETVFFNEYKSHALVGEFAGWRLPFRFEGDRQENERVRADVGLFDVSHMGELRVRGEKACEFLEWMSTNYVGGLKQNKAHYSLLLNEKSGVRDDVIIYCIKENYDYLLCVNAINKDKIRDWLLLNNTFEVEILDETDKWAQLALQGPRSFEVLKKVLNVSESPRFSFQIQDEMIIATTGYTGEKGVEIFLPLSKAVDVWRAFRNENVEPVGLAARDSLRIEMGYSLYGHEISEEINPLEAGLSWVVKPEKKEFLGKKSLQDLKITRNLVGFVLETSVIARQGYELMSIDKKPIGWVTSGTYSPSLQASIGMGYVDKMEGDEIQVLVRGKPHKARVTKFPFIKK